MSTKTATVTLTGGGLRFEAVPGSGHAIILDDGSGNTGPRPSELLAMALGGCTGMDVISILRKKRQVVTHYEVQVTAESSDDAPHTFTRFDATHVVAGEAIDPAAVARAIELSATKYCSVGSTLALGVPIRHAYVIRTDDGEDLAGEVIVLGPETAGATASA